MDNSLVVKLNQAAIDGIRSAGATSQWIFVEGNSWSGAWTWVGFVMISSALAHLLGASALLANKGFFAQTTTSGNSAGMGSLKDPQDKIVYEMHQYLDSDGSGTSATCVSSTIGQEAHQGSHRVAQEQWQEGHHQARPPAVRSAQCISALTGMLSYMASNSDVWQGLALVRAARGGGTTSTASNRRAAPHSPACSPA